MKTHYYNDMERVSALAAYVYGFAAGCKDTTLIEAADWLDKLSRSVCGQGYIGCRGGPECDSDHK